MTASPRALRPWLSRARPPETPLRLAPRRTDRPAAHRVAPPHPDTRGSPRTRPGARPPARVRLRTARRNRAADLQTKRTASSPSFRHITLEHGCGELFLSPVQISLDRAHRQIEKPRDLLIGPLLHIEKRDHFPILPRQLRDQTRQ